MDRRSGLRVMFLVVIACGLVPLNWILTDRLKAQATSVEPKFAVEMLELDGSPPSYVTLRYPRGTRLTVYGEDLHRITGANSKNRPPTALELEYKVEGDSVSITPLVFFGEFDHDNLETLDKLPREKAGVYSGRMNESVTLWGMAQFGLEPLTLKIVSARLEASIRPETVSKVPSVQIQIISEDREFYTVAVRNLSTNGVTAFSIDLPEKDGGQGATVTSELGLREVIAPGATYRVRIGTAGSGWMSNGVFIPNPPPPSMVLEAAFFQDGSYDGDARAVAEIAAQRAGQATQEQRAGVIMEAILAEAHSDDARVKRIRSAIAQLAEEPDAEMVESVRSRFPGLSSEAMERAKSMLKSGLNGEKYLLTSSLKNFERRHGRTSLGQWWSDWKLGIRRKF